MGAGGRCEEGSDAVLTCIMKRVIRVEWADSMAAARSLSFVFLHSYTRRLYARFTVSKSAP